MNDTLKAQFMSMVRHLITIGAGALGVSAGDSTMQLAMAVGLGVAGMAWGYIEKKLR